MAEDPSQIREAIEQTRAEIARTMEALGHKADVKQRLRHEVHEKSDEIKTRVSAQADQLAKKWSSIEQHARTEGLGGVGPTVSQSARRQAMAVGLGVLVLMVLVRRLAPRRITS